MVHCADQHVASPFMQPWQLVPRSARADCREGPFGWIPAARRQRAIRDRDCAKLRRVLPWLEQDSARRKQRVLLSTTVYQHELAGTDDPSRALAPLRRADSECQASRIGPAAEHTAWTR